MIKKVSIVLAFLGVILIVGGILFFNVWNGKSNLEQYPKRMASVEELSLTAYSKKNLPIYLLDNQEGNQFEVYQDNTLIYSFKKDFLAYGVVDKIYDIHYFSQGEEHYLFFVLVYSDCGYYENGQDVCHPKYVQTFVKVDASNQVVFQNSTEDFYITDIFFTQENEFLFSTFSELYGATIASMSTDGTLHPRPFSFENVGKINHIAWQKDNYYVVCNDFGLLLTLDRNFDEVKKHEMKENDLEVIVGQDEYFVIDHTLRLKAYSLVGELKTEVSLMNKQVQFSKEDISLAINDNILTILAKEKDKIFVSLYDISSKESKEKYYFQSTELSGLNFSSLSILNANTLIYRDTKEGVVKFFALEFKSSDE